MKTYEATGSYYVAPYTLPIFYTGTVNWPIIAPDGEWFVTLIGNGPVAGHEHDEQMVQSRATADKLVEILNKTINLPS